MASTNFLSFEDYQAFLSQPFVTPGCLLPANTRNHKFYLGPTFNVDDDVGHFPVAQIFSMSHTFPFLESLSLPSLRGAGIHTWPKSDTSFRAWHRQMIGHSPTRSMATLQDQLRSSTSLTGSGPLWLAQLWFRTYFPYFGAPSLATHLVRCYGLVVNELSPTTQSTPVEIPMKEKASRPNDQGKTPILLERQSQDDALPSLPREISHSPKTSDEDADSILRSIQVLFTSCEQVQASFIPCTSSVTRLSTFATPSTEDMDTLKRTLLAYTSFMDKDISRVNADSQKEFLVRLNENLATALKHPSLKLSASTRLTLRGIHQESKLSELSSEVMIEDSLLISLESEMKELQAKIDDYKMRLAAKKCNASLEIERTKALMVCYSEVIADDPDAVMKTLSIVDTHQCFEWSKHRDQMQSVLEELDGVNQ
ncbi:Uncharacterized protein Adt_39175 [Abeliophyllum distichum]|uniref:Aminotransferase-like plant mobile domain-containing protein n=1 Tax=Abeliophyllum distichum TaxID=126358 RepID=A0ABD1Q7A7_9LAMI